MTCRLLLALALLPLAACADADDAAVVDTDAAAVEPVDDMRADHTGMESTPHRAVTPQSTLDAALAVGGLTGLAPSAGIEEIDAWINRLTNEKDSPDAIVQDLQTLRSQLMATPRDADAIGATLIELGTETRDVADGNTTLAELGVALTSAGNTLRGRF